MQDLIEYEFTRGDGSKVYEFVGHPSHLWTFMRLHRAVKAVPVFMTEGR